MSTSVVGKGKWSWELTDIVRTPPQKPLNKSDFVITNRIGEVILRQPGQINGQQFVIETCRDCDFYLFDHSAVITVDECTNCRFFFGPIAGSVFIRDTFDCDFVIACQQFRTRTCRNLNILLHVCTQPIIEDSHDLRLGCFKYFYFNLKEQFDRAQVSVFNNYWSDVFNFTPNAGGYTLLSEDVTFSDLLRATPEVRRVVSEAEEVEVTVTCTSENASEPQSYRMTQQFVVPCTLGTRIEATAASGIAFFPSFSCDQALTVIENLRSMYPAVRIYNTRETIFSSSEQLTLVSKSDLKHCTALRSILASGPVIAVAVAGPDAIQSLIDVVAKLEASESSKAYVAQERAEAEHMIEHVFLRKQHSS